MNLRDFNFNLPPERIARFPRDKRDESKLMLVERKSGKISHHIFKDLKELIPPDDFIVLNNSKVMPVKMFGKIKGKNIEFIIVGRIGSNKAEVLAKPAKILKEDVEIELDFQASARVCHTMRRGRRIIEFSKPLNEILKGGYAPLPPYIKRNYQEARKYKNFDLARYQTIFSKIAGSIAAPTAGLHFSRELLGSIKNRVLEITLEVGEATFQKIETRDIRQHEMGKEQIKIDKKVQQEIKELKKSNQLIAVGTTSVRALETLAQKVVPGEEFSSEIFILPGFSFKLVDKLITNFHLPQSSLFILVAAFGGLELMHKAYKTAIEEKYRFFSYGDAMFII